MKSNWNYPTTVWTGENRSVDLNKACLVVKIKKPLFVTDKDLVNLPMTIKIIKNLKKDFRDIKIFSNFGGNPFGKNITEGVELYNNSKCDGVIAFGGGSALDVGKGIAFMCGQTRPLWDFEDIGDYWKRADESKISPIIAIPTTAGTGSETGRASAYCAPGFHPMADGIALEGMKLIRNSLSLAVKDGHNIKARSDMLAAASMGSTAFQKGLGAIHSLSHPVNAQFNVHHGLSNAIFMPYVLTFNKKEISEKILSICDYLSLEKSFDSFIKWVMKLREEFKIPHKLSEVVDERKIDLEKLSEMAFNDPSTSGNPKKLTKEDMKIMYQHSISGDLFL